MQILRWPIPPELKKSAEEHYRTRFARELQDKEPLEIIRQITFDGVAPNITIQDLKNILMFVRDNFLGSLSGEGLEVGAGPGTFSSVLASLPNIEKVYALEVCAPIVEMLGAKISNFVLGENQSKVVGVIGDFNQIKLPDNSLDFVFDFFSLHHSENLETTLGECHRVLKKDGFIFCFDKARPSHFSRKDLDGLLDSEYDQDFKKQIGVPIDQKFTRRMNDEKEYRLSDWEMAFRNSGFDKFEHFYLTRTVSGSFFKGFLKNFLSSLPVSIQVHLNKIIPEKKSNHSFILSSENKIFCRFVNPFPKNISLIIGRK